MEACMHVGTGMEERLAMMAMLFVSFLAKTHSSSKVTECPTGCHCNFSSDSVWNIRCVKNEKVVEPDRLSRQLDSLLSDGHIAERLTSLTIIDTPLTQVPASVCRLLNLTSLHLDRNKLVTLPNDCLTKLKFLEHLSAQDNSIRGLQDGVFDDLQKLISISLRVNNIATIGLRVFSNLTNLISLRTIDLSYNQLTSLEPWWYYRCIRGTETSRVNVFLADNLISKFTNELHVNFRCGMKRPFGLLSLSWNKIEHITDMTVGWGIDFVTWGCLLNMRGVSPGMMFRYYGDSFACDCVDFPLYAWQRLAPRGAFLRDVRCPSVIRVPSVQPALVISISLLDFVCEVTDRCPPSCRCVYRPGNATLHVHCSSTNLSSLPLRVPPLPKTYARYKLDFSNNKLLRHLDHRIYFNKTALLDISDCSIDHINASTWRQFSRMYSPFITPKIILQQNHISSVPSQVTAMDFTSVSFSLKDNPWNCSCENRWLMGWMQNLSFVSSNGEEVLCASPALMKGKSIVNLNETDFCTSDSEDHSPDTLKIVLSCTMAMLMLGMSVAVVLHRLKVRLYRRFKFHPFDRDECIGEDMDYDVFLCCNYEDHDPHGLHILDLLESMGYRVCYHLRDFLPGQLITDSMFRAIVGSKRTLCFMSHHFLNSSFCMTEFDMAFHHNVAVKRKKRLIVLMMLDDDQLTDVRDDDASEDTAALRQYMRQYTYIEYTADDWLDKLLYALPVGGLLELNQEHTTDDVQLLEHIQ